MDFKVTEAVAVKVSKERKKAEEEAHKKAEVREWKSNFDELRREAGVQ